MDHVARIFGEVYSTLHQLQRYHEGVSLDPNPKIREIYLDKEVPFCLQQER